MSSSAMWLRTTSRTPSSPATAVGIGRPYAYGLAVAGEDGVREVVRNHIAELDITMALAGHRSISEIGRDSLRAA